MTKKYFFLVSLLLFLPLTLWAEELPDEPFFSDFAIEETTGQMPDSVTPISASVSPELDAATRFSTRQLVFPAMAVSFGAVGTAGHLIDTRGVRPRHEVEDVLQYVPIGAYAALGFVPGVKHRHNIGDRLLAGATSYVLMTAVCQGTKHLVGEARPDGHGHSSFPSGHTATAFCGAELCRLEYGNAYGTAAYAFAATTGVMRVVNNRHWCNDVLAGAGIGFLAAHAGYWLLPVEKRLVRRIVRRPRNDSAFLLAPSYQYETKAPSLVFSMNF